MLGRGALRAVFGAPRVRAFAAAAFGRMAPPFWTHEDAGLGALIFREAMEQSLPLTYVALRRWKQHRAWINWADRSTLLDGDAMWVHYTRDATNPNPNPEPEPNPDPNPDPNPNPSPNPNPDPDPDPNPDPNPDPDPNPIPGTLHARRH